MKHTRRFLMVFAIAISLTSHPRTSDGFIIHSPFLGPNGPAESAPAALAQARNTPTPGGGIIGIRPTNTSPVFVINPTNTPPVLTIKPTPTKGFVAPPTPTRAIIVVPSNTPTNTPTPTPTEAAPTRPADTPTPAVKPSNTPTSPAVAINTPTPLPPPPTPAPPEPTATAEPARPTAANTRLPEQPTSTPAPPEPTRPPEPTATNRPGAPIPDGLFDEIVISQGFGGGTSLNVRNFDGSKGPVSGILTAMNGIGPGFRADIGGGEGRATHVSTGDVNGDGRADIVLSFGLVTEPAAFPNVIVPRDRETKAVIGHSFEAFPKGDRSAANYNGGEIYTAVGDFFGFGFDQIAAAQGYGGNGVVRIFIYTGEPAPNGWRAIHQFSPLPANANRNNANGGLTLAAGDINGDGKDELLAGQTNSPTSETVFIVYESIERAEADGADVVVEGRWIGRGADAFYAEMNGTAYAGFPPRFRGNGGVRLAVADLNGDGLGEILAGSLGNDRSMGGDRAEAPLNVMSVIVPRFENGRIAGFARPARGITTVFSEDDNPSGAFSFAAAELNGNRFDGQELIVGTGAVYQILPFIEQENLFKITPVLPAPESRYRLIKIPFDGESVGALSNMLGGNRGFPAFVGNANPPSGAIDVHGLPGLGFTGIPPGPQPPGTLRIGEFVLTSINYSSHEWNGVGEIITGANGFAWTRFHCDESVGTPPETPGDITAIRQTLDPKEFAVTLKVTDPKTQIGLEEALKFDPNARVGGRVIIRTPDTIILDEPLTAEKVTAELDIDIGDLTDLLDPPGDVRVQFEDLTIQILESGVGEVIDGRAFYPSAPPVAPDEFVPVDLDGFTLRIYALELTPEQATADADLEMPPSLLSGEDCRPAFVDLDQIVLEGNCGFYKELLNQPYGSWLVDGHQMLIYGPGLVADFSKDQTWDGWELDPPYPVAWKGVMLMGGETDPGSQFNPSNTGYLRAHYTFPDSIVDRNGLHTTFEQADPFPFRALQPFGYEVIAANGVLHMASSNITSGTFENGEIRAPLAAARIGLPTEVHADGSAGRYIAGYETLLVRDNLDLYSDTVASEPMVWGELTRADPVFAYGIVRTQQAFFLLGNEARDHEFVPYGAGNFQQPFLALPMENSMRTQGIQGLLYRGVGPFAVLTPDTPWIQDATTTAPIVFGDTSITWVNVASRGVHGFIEVRDQEGVNAGIGPTYQPYYEGNDTHFDPNLAQLIEMPNVPFDTHFSFFPLESNFRFFFIDSALFDSESHGHVSLGGAAGTDIPFHDMSMTSTAHIPGAPVVLEDPAELDYWELTLEQKENTSDAGVISFKTGQIFLTQAGLGEKRHFAKPFYLTWGELKSTGSLGELIFDFNSSGQKFDGFPYVPEAVGLSPYLVWDTTKELAHLQTGGEVHFEFFGPAYFNLRDFVAPFDDEYPFNRRRVELAFDDAHGTRPSEPNVTRAWGGNEFGLFDFDLEYDALDQDGFVGTGLSGLDEIDGMLSSSVVLDVTRICMNFYTDSDDDFRDFNVRALPRFSRMRRITGCGCIEDGALKRIHLAAELDATADAGIFVRSGAYSAMELDITPETTDLFMYGDLFLSLLAGFDTEMSGSARFAINRAASFVEGELEGQIRANGVTADGRLEWHIGGSTPEEAYLALQGRVGLSVISPIGGGGTEGGFYIAANAPRDNAWVLSNAGSKFSMDVGLMPDRLTGFYGYLQTSKHLNAYVFSGGIDVFTGLGMFINLGNLDGSSSGVTGLPFVVGNLGANVWGEILGGLVSAGAYADLDLIVPSPFSFEGTVGLEGCVVWVICGSVDLDMGLNAQDGFYVE